MPTSRQLRRNPRLLHRRPGFQIHFNPVQAALAFGLGLTINLGIMATYHMVFN